MLNYFCMSSIYSSAISAQPACRIYWFPEESEVCRPAESARQRHKACPESRVVPRIEEANLIGGKRALLFSFS